MFNSDITPKPLFSVFHIPFFCTFESLVRFTFVSFSFLIFTCDFCVELFFSTSLKIIQFAFENGCEFSNDVRMKMNDNDVKFSLFYRLIQQICEC